MKKLVVLFAFLSLAGYSDATVLTHGSVGRGHGVSLPSGDAGCNGTLSMNYDGSAENGYCWHYGGIVPPYYGAFAECYDAAGYITGIQLKLTSIGWPCLPCDLYVWLDDEGLPGSVLRSWAGYDPCPVAIWPDISTHDACVDCQRVDGPFWVGYWPGEFANSGCGYFIAADTNGFGGCPVTNVAPGVGYPTGWHSVSPIWGPTRAIGIGVWIGDCAVPTDESTWGQLKRLYR